MKKEGFHLLTDRILGSNNDTEARARSKQRQDVNKEMSKYGERVCKTFVNVLRARYPEDDDEETTKKMATKQVEDFVVGLVEKKQFETTRGSIVGFYRKWLINFLTTYETKRIIEDGNYTSEQLAEVFSFIKSKKSPEIVSIHAKVREIIHELYGASPKIVSDGLSKEVFAVIKRVVKAEINKGQGSLLENTNDDYENR